MTSAREIIPAIIALAGGQIVGRIRLQKIFYLLQQKGLNTDIRFVYHHYGPYSEDLSRSVDKASFIDKTLIEISETSSYGNTYSVFRALNQSITQDNNIGGISAPALASDIKLMINEQSVVIEIAATIHWLKYKESVVDWRTELQKRKGAKASDINVLKALNLLEELDLNDS